MLTKTNGDIPTILGREASSFTKQSFTNKCYLCYRQVVAGVYVVHSDPTRVRNFLRWPKKSQGHLGRWAAPIGPKAWYQVWRFRKHKFGLFVYPGYLRLFVKQATAKQAVQQLPTASHPHAPSVGRS